MLKLLLYIKLFGTIIMLIVIFWMGKVCFDLFNSKSYRITRILNSIFLESNIEYNNSDLEFMIKKDLLIKNKEQFMITNKGFDYMNSNNNNLIAYIALVVSMLSLFLSLFINFIQKK